MDDSEPRAEGPPPEAFAGLFRVAEVTVDDGQLRYYGEPLVSGERLERRLWPVFRDWGYEVRLTNEPRRDPLTGVETGGRRYVLVATPRSTGIDGVPWTNLLFAALTVLSTLVAGSRWYGADLSDPTNLLTGWPFALAVLSVLGVHELGHYALSRYHGVDASLPYFIPLPNVIGTMGAVIRMRGRMPDRKSLFDIGVAGPLAGLIATCVVTVVGLYLDPVPEPAIPITFNYPPLVQILADLTGQPLTYPGGDVVNPVVFAGWVGMFVTFLNLIPVGQLDGGHLVRAMVGKRHETVGALVPAALFGLAAYLYYVREAAFNAVFLWVLWGVFTLGFAYAGPATPIYEDGLDAKRTALGIVTFGLGALCFTPVPFELVMP
ncbi:site-2 protease family protein [Halococcus salifodinae]|uniref:Peptidase M50 n=1 Tax=Halococcus salifodinae DSM 8989 TaxID=1227456 RepID=M0NBI6_9EURY|nr:site-2 protease family protein [Halococcus salifodinae]EMA54928.1 peptidase M50 [Halococcus salifodinae DSM 8989]